MYIEILNYLLPGIFTFSNNVSRTSTNSLPKPLEIPRGRNWT